ncbi:biotin/lipoyl-binding protein [Oceanicoccus sagamiensis]|uniref:Uncharacterized protein n=1 Tax=Oceanicoccus sagamiensis TaxID=716816 RepID=A0A1X9NHV9_9GAMM|nr:biotin/lipoyl-binding protein [Oceanicoccus sagamiensis]ARN73573.1 hypothetical protein BST96_05230 [Oceanicoccus sagamiensis]
MDRVRQQPSKGALSPALIATAGLVVAAILISLFVLDFGSQRIDRDSVQIDTVQQGDLTIQVSDNGVLLPKDIEWIASRVEGRVAIIHKRAGDKVEAGDLLVELNNPGLVAVAEEALSALDGAKAEKLSYAVDLQNQLLNQKAASLQAKFDYESARLKLDAETQLREKSTIIADIDYRRTQLEIASNLLTTEFPNLLNGIAGITVGITLLMALLVLVACYLPARKIVKLEPAEALHYE